MRPAVGLVLVLTALSGTARGQEAPSAEKCSGPSLVLEPPLSHRWSWTKAAGETRRRVAELSDVDACMHFQVEALRESVHVRASAADGRSVVREVAKPSELEATVVALLVLPPAGRDEALPTEDSSADAGASLVAPKDVANPKPNPPPVVLKPPTSKPASRAVETPDESERHAPWPAGAPGHHGFELALATSGRSTGYLFGPGASTVADWDLGGWLVGGAAHAERVSGPSDVASRFSVEWNASLAGVFGRRLVRRPFVLDVALEVPVLAFHASRWTSHTVSSPPGDSESDDGTGEDDHDDAAAPAVTSARTQTTAPNLDLRAGGFVRAVVPFAGHFGAALTADGERSLGVPSATRTSGEPASLAWNFGVALGLFWSGG